MFRIPPCGKGSQRSSRHIVKARVQPSLGVFVEEVQQSSVTTEQAEECHVLDQAETDPNDWREPIIKYIKNEEEPDGKAVA
jgi:hypothetical protein